MSGELAETVAPSGAEVGSVAYIEGAEDFDNAERRGVEDISGSIRDLALRNALCLCKPEPMCFLLASYI